MSVLVDCMLLVGCVSAPYLLALGLRKLIHVKETQLSNGDIKREGGGHKPLWKPHKKLRSLWGIAFALMGLATWRVVRRGGLVAQAEPLTAYACVLFSSALAWPPLFFGGHSLYRAIVETAVWVGSVWWAVVAFHKVDGSSAFLLLPFLAMSSFSTFLINCSFHARREVVEEATRLSALKRPRKSRVNARSPGSHNLVSPVTPHPVARRLSISDAISGSTPAAVPTPASGERKGTSQDSEAALIPSPTALDRLGTLVKRVSAPVYGRSSILMSLSSKVSEVVTGTLSPDKTEPVSPVEGGAVALPEAPTSDSIPLHYFTCPGSAGFKVRGRHYLEDKQKWVPQAPDFTLFAMDLLSVSEPTYHIARYLPSIKASKLPFHFLWQVMVPGRPNISLTITWALDYDPVEAVKKALERNALGTFDSGIPEDPSQDPEGSGSSFDSVATDYGAAGSREGGKGGDDGVERSTHSTSASDSGHMKNAHHRRSATQLSSLETEGSKTPRRHRRATTEMDGSYLTPKKEPAPASGGWWGSTPSKSAAGAGTGKEADDPAKYAGCKSLDVALMRFIEGAGPDATDEEHARERNSQAPPPPGPFSLFATQLPPLHAPFYFSQMHLQRNPRSRGPPSLTSHSQLPPPRSQTPKGPRFSFSQTQLPGPSLPSPTGAPVASLSNAILKPPSPRTLGPLLLFLHPGRVLQLMTPGGARSPAPWSNRRQLTCPCWWVSACTTAPSSPPLLPVSFSPYLHFCVLSWTLLPFRVPSPAPPAVATVAAAVPAPLPSPLPPSPHRPLCFLSSTCCPLLGSSVSGTPLPPASSCTRPQALV